MNNRFDISPPIRRLVWRLLSFPIYIKIVGIGLLTSAIFGGVTLYLVRSSSISLHYPMLEKRNLSVANALAAHLEQQILTGKWFEIQRELRKEKTIFPDIRYIIISDHNGKIISHTFPGAVPAGLMGNGSKNRKGASNTQVFNSDEGTILEVVAPVSGGSVGYIRVGALDEEVEKEIAIITRAVLTALGTSAVFGLCLALLLTNILVMPLNRLRRATEEIRSGQFGIHTSILSDDEIGALTKAFNHMSDQLKKTSDQVLEKEAARLRLVQKTIFAQEDERKRIARELHDELGQSLSALLLATQQSVQQADQSQVAMLRDIETKTRCTLEMVRRLAWNLRPSILDDYGLATALSRCIEDSSRQSGIKIDFHYNGREGEKRLPDRVEVTLFRIAQESISNILRHSNAAQASIVLTRQDDTVTLLVEDDGIGFNPVEVENRNGMNMGMIGIKERVALLEGEFLLESQPGKGCIIRVKIPLKGIES